jgi:hypothetical protein
MDQTNGFYGGPPLMNPPPRIFGNLQANGSPMPAQMAATMFSADDYDAEDRTGTHCAGRNDRWM